MAERRQMDFFSEQQSGWSVDGQTKESSRDVKVVESSCYSIQAH